MTDADKGTPPATDTGATGEPATKETPPADTQPDAATQQARITELEGQVAAKDKSYGELRRVYNQRDTEINQLRSVQTVPTNRQLATEVDPTSGTFTNADRENLDVIKFKQDNPDYGDHWDAIQAIIDDPVRVRDVAVPSADGLGVDTGRSLKMAYLQVKNDKNEAARRVRDADKAKLDAEKNANNQRAVISGMGASDSETGVAFDIKGMSYAEALREAVKRGLVPVSETDPPNILTGK